MNKLLIFSLATATLLGGCTSTGGYSSGYDDGGYGYYDRSYSERNGRYDYNNPDPRRGGYYADDYYRNDRRYRERRLETNDRIYRGRDGRYYCRRSDGTTGLVIGGVVGGIAGVLGYPKLLFGPERASVAIFVNGVIVSTISAADDAGAA